MLESTPTLDNRNLKNYSLVYCICFQVRTKEDRKKSPVQEEVRGPMMRERSKSEGRGKDSLQLERAKIAPPGNLYNCIE